MTDSPQHHRGDKVMLDSRYCREGETKEGIVEIVLRRCGNGIRGSL